MSFLGRAGFLGLGYRFVSFGLGGERTVFEVDVPIACFDGTISPVNFAGKIRPVTITGDIDPITFAADIEDCD